MLDTLMLATEPFGTWGPGPIPEPASWWARLLESIASDPRAVATIVAAFVGFLGGVLIKDWLDRRREGTQRKQQTIRLAGVLHAELYSLRLAIEGSLRVFERKRERASGDDVSFGTVAWLSHQPPNMTIYNAKIDQLDCLPKQIAGDLTSLNMEVIDLQKLIARSSTHIEKDGSRVGIPGLRLVEFRLHELARKIEKLNQPLAGVADAEPHNWEKILRELSRQDKHWDSMTEDSSNSSE